MSASRCESGHSIAIKSDAVCKIECRLSQHAGPELWFGEVAQRKLRLEDRPHPIVEPGSRGGRRFKPPGDCAPGHPFDPGHSRNRKTVDTHADDFIEQRPGFVQPIIRRAVSGGEGSTALLAAVAPSSALPGDVEGVSDDVAFAGLSSQGAIGVWTGARSCSAVLHTCSMAEYDSEIQVGSRIARVVGEVNNTSLEKHPVSIVFALLAPSC